MPYGVGGSIAEGLQSGFEMGRSVTQDAERKREFEAEQAIKKEQADRLWQQERDRYGRMQDEAQVKAQQDHLAMLDKLAAGYQERGEPVSPEVNTLRAQAAARLAQMHQQISTTGRLVAAPDATLPAPNTQGGVTAPAPRPNVASADTGGAPLPNLPPPPPAPQAAPQGAVQGAQPQPAGAQPAQPQPAAPQGAVQSQPAAGLGPQPGPVGMGVDGLAPGGALPPGAAAPPAPAIDGGQPQAATVASPTTSAITPQQQFVTQTDQASQDLASRLNTGQMKITDVAPKDFALMVASATKHAPGDLSGLTQGVADFHAGMQTGNNGLVIQGLNGVYGPAINTGVGQPSDYGGNVVSKKIIGLDPAVSADGTVHPDRVMPRLQVTTDQLGPDGTPLTYHAPLLGPDGKVAAIPLTDAFNHIGAVGALSAVAAHPDAQALLAKGANDPDVQRYLDAYNAQAQPVSKTQILENHIQAYMATNHVDHATAERAFAMSGETPWQLSVPHGAGQSDAAFINDIMTRNPSMSYEDAAALAQRTMHPSRWGAGGPGLGGGVQGSGALPGAATAGGGTVSPEDFLQKLSSEDRQSVLNVARDPTTLANISTAKGRREHVQNLAEQYLQTQSAQGTVHLGKGAAGIDEQGNPIGGINPQSIDWYSTLALGGDQSWRTGLSRSQQGAELIRAVDNNVPKMAQQLGLSPADVGTNKAESAALTKTLADRTKYVTAIDQLNGTLDKQAALVQSLLAKGGATEAGPLFNAPYNKVREALGSVDAHNLDMALVGLGREHQRVIVSPLSNAQLAVQAQQTGDKLINLNLTPSQIMGAISVARTEAANAKAQGAQTLEETRQRIHSLYPGGVKGAASAASAAGGAAPAATSAAFGSLDEAQAAASAGKLPAGTRITIGGVPGTWN